SRALEEEEKTRRVEEMKERLTEPNERRQLLLNVINQGRKDGSLSNLWSSNEDGNEEDPVFDSTSLMEPSKVNSDAENDDYLSEIFSKSKRMNKDEPNKKSISGLENFQEELTQELMDLRKRKKVKKTLLTMEK